MSCERQYFLQVKQAGLQICRRVFFFNNLNDNQVIVQIATDYPVSVVKLKRT